MASFRGVLLDIDGVLHVSLQAVAGANETLLWLEQRGYQICFVTNTTTSSRATLVQNLKKIGLSLDEERVVTAPVVTANYIHQQYPDKRCWLLTKGDTARDFAGIYLVESHADIIVIGVPAKDCSWIAAPLCTLWNSQQVNVRQFWVNQTSPFSSRPY